jgi:hypothetical protein
MLKDHLGNVRTVLTDEQQKDIYQATMEMATQAFELALFGQKVIDKQVGKPIGFDNDATNAKVCMLRPKYGSTTGGTTNNGTSDIGSGVMLKVMAGDKFTEKLFIGKTIFLLRNTIIQIRI